MKEDIFAEIFQNKNIIMFLTTFVYILGLYAFFTKASIIFAIIVTVSFMILLAKNLISPKLLLFWTFIFYLGYFNCVLQIKNSDELVKFAPNKCEIVGQIKSIPKQGDYNTKFYFLVKEISVNGKTLKDINATTFVSVNNQKNLELKIHDYYKMKGLLRTPLKAGNPSQFDYANYLKNFDTHTVFYTKGKDVENIQHEKSLLTKSLQGLNDLRIRIIDTHSKYLKYPNTEILGGIVFGDDAVSPPDFIKTSFIKSGLLHILAASGMNVAFIYGFWYWILHRLKVPFKIILVSGIFMIILYALMTGLGASVIRAAFMLIFILLGKLINRDTHSVALLSLVGLLMLIYNPAYINNVSFQLSFLVTFGLLVSADSVFEKFKKVPQWLSSAIGIPIIAQIWVIPLQMFYFNTISTYSIFANILTVPFLSIVSFLGFVSSVLSIIKPIADFVCKYVDIILNPLLTVIVWISDYFGNLGHSIFITTHPSVFQIIIYYIIVMLCILMLNEEYRGKRVVFSTVSLVMILLISCINIPNKNMELITFDVQNADMFLVKSPQNKYFIIDTGKSGYNGGNSQATSVIIKYMKDRGIKNIEGLIVTHFDNDHSGGASDIIDYAKVKKVYINTFDDKSKTSKEIYNRTKDRNAVLAKNNEEIYKENDFKITTFRKSHQKNDNENSIITMISNKNLNILMMGDASMENLPKEITKAQILKVGHHGAKSVVNTNKLKALDTDISIISTGTNKFGHPNIMTLKNLNNTQIFRTDKNNSIKIVSNGDEYKVLTFDRDKKNYVKKVEEKV